jgi:hypothetical protein
MFFEKKDKIARNGSEIFTLYHGDLLKDKRQRVDDWSTFP